jgi:hypothetical protein
LRDVQFDVVGDQSGGDPMGSNGDAESTDTGVFKLMGHLLISLDTTNAAILKI